MDAKARRKVAAVKGMVAAGMGPPAPSADSEQVTRRQDGDVFEARSVSRKIRTVEDLLAHIEADMTRFEVAASEATKWEVGTSDGKGGTTVTELHRVFVRLKPRGGPRLAECVESMIASASRSLRLPAGKATKKGRATPGPWQVLVVADCHFGKYAWARSTGGEDFDLAIASERVGSAASELLEVGDLCRPARRTIAFLGDLFHYDTPSGTTSSGTPLERDGRLQKMLEIGCQSLLAICDRSSETVPTDVVIVNGNHDETLTWAFQRIALERYAASKRVAVSNAYTGRQYIRHGRVLLGFAHGHRAKRRLPQLMALEAAADWSESVCREYHTGHFHSQAAEWQRPIETIDGVIVRTAPAICPADDWHAAQGFVGSRQAMETFIYDAEGLASMHCRTGR